MCGEKRYTSKPSPPPAGSPPRVRGKAPPPRWKIAVEGITPACAGKSISENRIRVDNQDHPRVCGEKSSKPHVPVSYSGSPPRVRGKGMERYINEKYHRITPACAGKSSIALFTITSAWDHPRMCGEKAAFGSPFTTFLGSPPRVRGKASIADYT